MTSDFEKMFPETITRSKEKLLFAAAQKHLK